MRIAVTKYSVAGYSILLLAIIVSVISSSPLAYAATFLKSPDSNTGITISPTQKEIIIDSGLITADTSVMLTNNTGSRLIGSIKLLDFKTLDETGGLFLAQTGSTKTYGLANWMTLPNGDVVNIAEGQSTMIPIKIANRADLAPGGHYGAMVVTFGSPSTTGDGKANFKQQLVSLLFVKKRGGEEYGLQLTSLTANKPGGLPTAAILNFKSTGNVHVSPRGYVVLADPKGMIVAKGTINIESTLILPGTNKSFESYLQNIGSSNQVGRYKLTAYYRYDEQNEFSQSTIYVNRARSVKPIIIIIGLTTLISITFWQIWRIYGRVFRRL